MARRSYSLHVMMRQHDWSVYVSSYKRACRRISARADSYGGGGGAARVGAETLV